MNKKKLQQKLCGIPAKICIWHIFIKSILYFTKFQRKKMCILYWFYQYEWQVCRYAQLFIIC